MKCINKTVLVCMSLVTAFTASANDLSLNLKQKIADKLTDISKTEKIEIRENETLNLIIKEESFEIDVDLVQELEERGMLELNTVARTGARCIRT